jgi:SAM-dependent methyltransferase
VRSEKQPAPTLAATPLQAEYWESIYSEPQTMDGICNASLHADYIHALFALDAVQIKSVLDVGYGLGHLFNAVLKRFKPYCAVGIEPSEYAFDRAASVIRAPHTTRLKLLSMNVQTWCEKPRKPARFDLTLCTSVLQYLDDATVTAVLQVLAERTRFMYLTVPTYIEAQRMSSEYGFDDGYAIHRTRDEYRHLIDPHFTVIGSRLLESKAHYDETTTPFSELFYRSD